MFFPARNAAFALSSVNRELPPSTTMSPSSSRSASSWTVSLVGSPAGTMIHTARGASSLLTMSLSDAESLTSGLRS